MTFIEAFAVGWNFISLAWALVELFKDEGGPGVWIPSIPCCIFVTVGALIILVVNCFA